MKYIHRKENFGTGSASCSCSNLSEVGMWIGLFLLLILLIVGIVLYFKNKQNKQNFV